MTKLAVVMDPIQSINPQKDSTFALLLEAQKRKFTIFYFELNDLFIKNGQAYGQSKILQLNENHSSSWFYLEQPQLIPLRECDVILMRKDPPFNLEYIYATYILEQAEREGVKIINKPQSLRDANEKIFATQFPSLCPETLVTRNMDLLKDFLHEHQQVVFKPIDSMGGRSIFLIDKQDFNANVVIETLTQWGTQTIMAQTFIPEIRLGDKRILLINGRPFPYALNRIPPSDSIRGNLASGGTGIVVPLSDRDYEICHTIADSLINKGLYFVGIDVIGHYLTEINVTSPTGIQQIEQQTGKSITHEFFDNLHLF